jgi:uncharacterized RDD family membrane protein YckC
MPVSTPQRSRLVLLVNRRGLGLVDVLVITAVVALLVFVASRQFPLYEQPPAPGPSAAQPAPQ